MRPCCCFPRQHDWVWREPPLFDQKKALEHVIPLAFYHLNLEEWLPFNSRGWSTSRTALLQKTETCCTTTSYSKILFSVLAHIHNTDMVVSGPLHVPPCTPQKDDEWLPLWRNPQKRPTPTRCRMSKILQQSDTYQSLKIHRTCKVMIKVPSKFVVLQTWV